MRKTADKRARRVNRLQNLAIVLLTASALLLAANLPLFGALSDQSLIDLARGRNRAENSASDAGNAQTALAFPVRMVYTNDFARIGEDSVTTVSDGFEHAGMFLGEALGSARDAEEIGERVFLDALLVQGLYFDFTAALPLDVLSGLLGISVPELELTGMRRMLLSPGNADEAQLYVQDGEGREYRFQTAVSSTTLTDFLAARSGESADFAFMLGDAYARLSPYTLVLSAPAARGSLTASGVLSGNEDVILRRAEFNAHTENRFTESSGTVIVREASSALYLRPNGTVDYQGGAVSPDSLYYVKAEGGEPTSAEAAAAAQRLAVTLTQDMLGDASLYLCGVARSGGRIEVTLDLMVDGTPLRFADGSHAVSVTIEGPYITAFTLKARSYTRSGEEPLLLPFAQAAAIARLWDGAELIVAYIDAGGDTVQPAWIAE